MKYGFREKIIINNKKVNYNFSNDLKTNLKKLKVKNKKSKVNDKKTILFSKYKNNIVKEIARIKINGSSFSAKDNKKIKVNNEKTILFWKDKNNIIKEIPKNKINDASFNTKDNKKAIIKCVDIEKEVKTASFSSMILKNINLEIYEGEIVIILGPSGSGKTTLLNIIASIDKPSKGNVYIDDIIVNKLNDKELTKLRREKISYIYQRYGLIPISTVFDNIKLGQNLVEKEDRKIDFDMIISKIGLQNYLSKFPHELSGGQKQRVAIARAILKQPRLMLCDEPTGALDEETSKNIIDLFLTINKEYKTTIVMVTHNNNLVSIADKVVYIKDGCIEKIEYKKI